MSELTTDDFSPFFEAIYGYRPHSWQVRLAQQVLHEKRWPDLLDLPTGVGKTSALDIALFSLAVSPENFPRRIIFVVDRRLIVDQVGERAQQLEQALCNLDSPEVVRNVALRLHALSGSDGPVVGHSTLRGGVNDRSWAARPDTPWIMVSTVDQVGSRLLFRGYGVSSRMQPIHAGLVGTDALLLLDEVHISQAFAQTLRTIGNCYRPPQAARPWQVVEMSATPRHRDPVVEPFTLVPSDLDPETSPIVSAVVTANKPARLVTVGKKRQAPAEAIAAAIVDITESLADADSVAVVVNRVATALETANELSAAGYEPLLLTGRMRPFEREQLLADPLFGRFAAGGDDSSTRTDERPLVLVSTQAIEVGADLDFGAMITECAPIDALRQRFGRVDRRGQRAAVARPGEVRILGVANVVDSAKPPFDPVYGESLRNAWRWLSEQADEGGFDAGIQSAILADAPAETLAPSEQAPLLLSSHLDAFVQTEPEPVHQPSPALWLHGTDETDTDIRIVWRADLHEALLQQASNPNAVPHWLVSLLAARPPRDREALAIPISAVKRWLNLTGATEVADINARLVDEQPPSAGSTRLAVRWSPSQTEVVGQVSDLRPGDLLVVPSTYGGVMQRTWSPSSGAAVLDLADLVLSAEHGTQASVRLLPEFFGDATPLPDLLDVDEGTDRHDVISSWADTWRSAEPPERADPNHQLLRTILDGHYDISVYPVGEGQRYLLRQTGGPEVADPVAFDGSDTVNSMLGKPITLRSHLAGVGELARDFARRCGLSANDVDDFELAGRLHDLGKLDQRFQTLLHNGDVLAAASATEPLAKSATGWQKGVSTAHLRDADRYPPGTRHELLSVAMAEAYPELMARAHDPDLVRYLIASHHGYCRPFAPPQADPVPVEVSGRFNEVEIEVSSVVPPELRDARTADRFWHLVRKHGWYGLAGYEAIFRLADHRRSELEQSGRVSG